MTLPIDDTNLILMTTIHGLRVQLDSRDETIRDLRSRIETQAESIRDLYAERQKYEAAESQKVSEFSVDIGEDGR